MWIHSREGEAYHPSGQSDFGLYSKKDTLQSMEDFRWKLSPFVRIFCWCLNPVSCLFDVDGSIQRINLMNKYRGAMQNPTEWKFYFNTRQMLMFYHFLLKLCSLKSYLYLFSNFCSLFGCDSFHCRCHKEMGPDQVLAVPQVRDKVQR